MPEDLQPDSHGDDSDKVKVAAMRKVGDDRDGHGVCAAYLHATIASCKRRELRSLQSDAGYHQSFFADTKSTQSTCQHHVFTL